MTTAKVLIELPGVEAGSKYCGDCELESGHDAFDCDAVYCPAFRDPSRGRDENGKFLRLPACLAAEEAAKNLGRNPGLDEALNMGDGSYKP